MLTSKLVLADSLMRALSVKSQRHDACALSTAKQYLRRGALLVALLALTDVAPAGTDWKTYAGTACQAGHRSQLIDYDAFGGVCNTSSDQNVVVHCPLVRDFSESRFPIFVRHSGRTGSLSQALQCTLRSMRREAGTAPSAMEHRAFPLTEIPFSGINMIQAKDTEISRMTTESWGALVLTCDLPPSFVDGFQIQSCLYNYSVREWDGN
jgi:hypothetical protein